MGSTLHGVLVFLAVIGGLTCGSFCMIYALIRIIRKKQPGTIFFFVMMILCHLIAAAAWIFNIGWIRLILIFLAVPFIHSALFTVVNTLALPHLIHSVRLAVYTLITDITYVLMYAFLPDIGDADAGHVFFGLIYDYGIDEFWVLSAVCLIVYIVFTVLQIIETVQTKKRVKMAIELQEGNWDEFAV